MVVYICLYVICVYSGDSWQKDSGIRYQTPLRQKEMDTSVSSVQSVVSDSLWPHGLQHEGLPDYHHLLEFTQTHVHWVNYAIQPSHPLSSPSPPSSNLSHIRVFSNESALHIRWPKYWSFSFSISPCKIIILLMHSPHSSISLFHLEAIIYLTFMSIYSLSLHSFWSYFSTLLQ